MIVGLLYLSRVRQRQQGPNAFADLQARIRNVRDIVGPVEVSAAVRMMDGFAERPSVGKRNALLNLVGSWCVRQVETSRADAYVVRLKRDLDTWTLSYMTDDVTDYDAPRPFDRSVTTYDMHV
jgi:hypothetical protein